MKRALVTGGAGLIGSHVVDLLVREGWLVRALDNLEPQTHRCVRPTWVNKRAEFVEGDLRDHDTITAALDRIDFVFHQAASPAFTFPKTDLTKGIPEPRAQVAGRRAGTRRFPAPAAR